MGRRGAGRAVIAAPVAGVGGLCGAGPLLSSFLPFFPPLPDVDDLEGFFSSAVSPTRRERKPFSLGNGGGGGGSPGRWDRRPRPGRAELAGAFARAGQAGGRGAWRAPALETSPCSLVLRITVPARELSS